MRYRIGYLGWKVLAKIGLVDELEFRVFVHYDEEVKRFWATSPDLPGLVCEADTPDELKEAVDDCARVLVERLIDSNNLSRAVSMNSYLQLQTNTIVN